MNVARSALWYAIQSENNECVLLDSEDFTTPNEAKTLAAIAAVRHATLVSELMTPPGGALWPIDRSRPGAYQVEAAKAFLIVHSPFTYYDRLGFTAFAKMLEDLDAVGQPLDLEIAEQEGGWSLDRYTAWLGWPDEEFLAGNDPIPEYGSPYAMTQEALHMLATMMTG